MKKLSKIEKKKTKIHKVNVFTEQQDNIICTFVRLYQFNVSFGLGRASEYLGLTYGSVSSRYYNKLRNERKIFHSEFGTHEIWNTKRITKDELKDLVKYESHDFSSDFEELEERQWWKENQKEKQ